MLYVSNEGHLNITVPLPESSVCQFKITKKRVVARMPRYAACFCLHVLTMSDSSIVLSHSRIKADVNVKLLISNNTMPPRVIYTLSPFYQEFRDNSLEVCDCGMIHRE